MVVNEWRAPVDPQSFDVVFIGGGPVGLWTAVQTKLRNPELNITVLEKYPSYKRIHALSIKAWSLATNCQHPELQRVISKFKAQPLLSTATIQSDLSALAEKVGVVIQYGVAIKDFSKDLDCFSNARVIVGTDGAHSRMREHVVGESGDACLEMKSDMHYIADLTYTENRAPLGLFAKCSHTIAHGNGIHEIHNKKKNTTTLRTFISPEVYADLQEAKRKNPVGLSDPAVDKELRDEYLGFLNYKYEDDIAGHLDLEAAQISTTTLGCYISKSLVKSEGTRTSCVVGDAAFGVPFFRSLNNGFYCGTDLSKVIAQHGARQPDAQSEAAFRKYEKATLSYARWQVFSAKVKSTAINVGLQTVKILRKALSIFSIFSLSPTSPMRRFFSWIKSGLVGAGLQVAKVGRKALQIFSCGSCFPPSSSKQRRLPVAI